MTELRKNTDKEFNEAYKLNELSNFITLANTNLFFYSSDLKEKPVLEDCKKLKGKTSISSTNEYDKLYKKIVLLERNNNNQITSWCKEGYKKSICIHKTTLQIHLNLLNIQLLVPAKKTGWKRKYDGALETKEEIDKKKKKAK